MTLTARNDVLASSLLFSFRFAPNAFGANRKGKKEVIILRSQPRAALVPRLPWAIIVSSLRDFRLAREWQWLFPSRQLLNDPRLLGRVDVATTQIYRHVLSRHGLRLNCYG